MKRHNGSKYWKVGYKSLKLSDICLIDRELLLTTRLCHWMAIYFLYVKLSGDTISVSDSSL